MSSANDSTAGASAFGFPGARGMQDMFEAMQKSWGFPAMPQLAPTLDPEEIDKRIADLQTVAQWLTVNQNMLQSTIQALQMQRATLATFKAFGEAGVAAGETFREAGVAAGESLREAGVAAGETFREAGDLAAEPDFDDDLDDGVADEPDEPAPRSRNRSDAAPGRDKAAAEAAAPTAAVPQIDPEQWWNILRSQFEQVTNAALGSLPTAVDSGAVEPAKSDPVRRGGKGPASGGTDSRPRKKAVAGKSPPKAGTRTR